MVRKMVEDPDWPFERTGPWDLAEVEHWRTHRYRATTKTTAAKEALQLRKLQLECRRLEEQVAQLEAAREQSVSIGDHEHALRRLAEIFVQALAGLERTLPLELAGLEPPEMELAIRERLDEGRRRLLAERDSAVLQTHKELEVRPGRPREDAV